MKYIFFRFFFQIMWVLIMIPCRIWNWLSVHVANLPFQVTLNHVTQLHSSLLWITVPPGTYIISSSVDRIQTNTLPQKVLESSFSSQGFNLKRWTVLAMRQPLSFLGLAIYFKFKILSTHSSILAWRIPWTEELGGLESVGRKSRTRLHFHFHFILLQKH